MLDLYELVKICLLHKTGDTVADTIRSKTRKRRSLFRKAFFIGLNTYLLFLLLDYSFLKTTSFYILGISLLIFIFEHIAKQRRNAAYHSKSNPVDVLRIMWKYLKINRRYILISAVGLILATVMISQTMLTASSYKQHSLENYVSPNRPFIYVSTNTGDTTQDYTQMQTDVKNLVYKDVSETSFSLSSDSLVSATNLNMKIGTTLRDPNSPDVQYHANVTYLQIRTWSKDDITAVNYIFNTNFNGSEKLLITDPYISPVFEANPLNNITYLVNAEFQVNQTDFIFLNDTYSTQLSVPQNMPEQIIRMRENGVVSDYLWYLSSNIILLSPNDFYNLRNNVIDLLPKENTNTYYYIPLDLYFNFYADKPNIVDNSIDRMITELTRLRNTINSDLQQLASKYDSARFSYYNVQMPLLEELQSFRDQTQGFQTLLVILSMPLVGVSLFLVYFSITLVEQRKSRIIGIMKIRGTSTRQIQIQQIGEVLITGIIAGIVGMILSLPWVVLTLKTSGFFAFKGSGIPLYIPNTWYSKLPQIGIILTLDLYINSIIDLSSSSTESIEEVEEKRPPFWQRMYLDLILFTISTGFWIFIRVVPIANDQLKQILYFGIGPYLLIAFLLSAPLVASRYFSDLISDISDVLWKLKGNLIALATKNMGRNKYSSSRLVALLLLGMMLSMMAVIIPYSVQQNSNEQVHYDLGADIVIRGVDITNSTQMNQILVNGVDAVTPVVKSYYYPETLNPDSKIYQYEIMGINKTTFSQAAYWKSSYAKQGLSSIISNIDNTTAGISTAQMTAAGLKQGGIIPGLPNNTQLTIESQFKYFPNLITYEPTQQDGYYEFYGSLQLLTGIDYVLKNLDNLEQLVYAKASPSANLTRVTELITKALNKATVTIDTYQSRLNDLQESDEFTLILASFQSLLIITVIISSIAVVYFSIITISERNKEIGTLRAIGMVKSQIFILLVVESLVLLFSGVIFGMLAGWFISSNVFFLITNPTFGSDIPPQYIAIPYTFVLSFILVVLIASVLSAVVPARSMAERQTGNILRAE